MREFHNVVRGIIFPRGKMLQMVASDRLFVKYDKTFEHSEQKLFFIKRKVYSINIEKWPTEQSCTLIINNEKKPTCQEC